MNREETSGDFGEPLMNSQDSFGQRPVGKPIRLLIADDDPNVRLLIAATLATRDLEILQADTGSEALALVRSHQPSVALLDGQMPEMDGFEVCEHIKADPLTAS